MSEKSQQRVIVFSLDAAELSLIEQHAAAGDLPHIATLLRRSRPVPLAGPASPDLAWMEILAGCGSGRTGYHSPLVFVPETYSVRNLGAYDFEVARPFYAYCLGR